MNLPENTPKTTQENIDWLLKLGLPVFPNTASTGEKRPAYFNKGTSCCIKWKTEDTKQIIGYQPEYFRNGEGVSSSGAFINGYYLTWLDFDAKDYALPDEELKTLLLTEKKTVVFSQLKEGWEKDPATAKERCMTALEEWIKDYPQLEKTPIAITQNNGCRVLVAVRNIDDRGCNQAFSTDEHRI